MGDKGDTVERTFEVFETVRCLECGAVYAKPASGGTVQANPGCPDCGYVGWLATSVPGDGASAPSRYDVDRRRSHSA